VYDREEGRVYVGIDKAVLNLHSGAESNVVGALALRDLVIRTAPALAPLVEKCFAPDVRGRLGGMQKAGRR
jgi:hypothetical protein